MTIYNVVEDRAEWARVKASLMTPADRQAMMAELIRRDDRTAARIVGEIASAEHGKRAVARQRVSYPA